MNAFHHLRALRLKRQADQLLQRANANLHRQSAHQTCGAQQRNRLPEIHRSPLFALAVIAIAFGAGYVVADDKRIEHDQQEQVAALCAKPWPDAPGAAAARRRACQIKKQG